MTGDRDITEEAEGTKEEANAQNTCELETFSCITRACIMTISIGNSQHKKQLRS